MIKHIIKHIFLWKIKCILRYLHQENLARNNLAIFFVTIFFRDVDFLYLGGEHVI